MIIRTQVHARAGFLGNPSDMYGGKVISFLIRDFSARVQLWESPALTFLPNPEHDRTEFSGLSELVNSIERHGYYGMQRLLFATCKRFADYARERAIPLRRANFTIAYQTTIPRQSGLGGSSAMIIAALQALLRFYRVPARRMPPAELAELALGVEVSELGIAAGLQDRVVQSYGGLTYMDFSPRSRLYQRLDSKRLPRFGLAYLAEQHLGTMESGRVHSQVRYRWEQGDPEVRATMRQLARTAEQGRSALERGDLGRLPRLMNRNHDLRVQLFGQALGAHNLELVEIARGLGLAAKLPGSSGAALVLLADAAAEGQLASAYAAKGYRYQPIEVF
ncbi:MAG: mevalonate kinase [Armatimonadota bacterium]